MGNNLGDLFFRGGWVMWPLLLFSLVTWAVIFERAWVLFLAKMRFQSLFAKLSDCLQDGDIKKARAQCEAVDSLLGQLFKGALDGPKDREVAVRAVERNAVRMTGYLKKNLWILGTIASASPFIGLLGTVVGIVRAFHEMAEKGAGGFSVVAGGISEALIATAAGLIVAIVALLTYNMFMTFSNQFVANLRLSLDEILDGSLERGAKA